MPNTNFQTFHQMGNAINDVVRQATGRDNVQNIDMDFVTVAQRKRLVEKIITGNPVTFFTNMVSPLDYLIAQINPIQDLHGYADPWVGGAGKNKIDVSASTTGKMINSSGAMYNADYGSASDYIPVSEGAYIFSAKSGASESVTRRIYGYDSSKSPVQSLGYLNTGVMIGDTYSISITVPNGASYVRISYVTADTELQLESGSTVTSYAPFSNICPISGWDSVQITRTGKNLFDENGEYQYKRFYDDSGNMGTATTAPYPKLFLQKIPVLPNTVYSYSGKSTTNVYLRIYQFNSNDEFISRAISTSTTNPSVSVTTDANVSYVLLGPDENVTEAQFEKGTASAYEPFGNVYPISLPTTVYGGTLTVNKDGSGTLLVTHQLVEFDGTDDTGWSLWTPVGEGNNYFRYNDGMNFNYQADASEFKCNMFGEPVTIRATNSNLGYKITTINGFDFRYAIDNSLTVNDLMSFFTENPLQIIIPMKETVTYTISAEAITTVIGENNIWADTGDVTVLYKNYEEVI